MPNPNPKTDQLKKFKKGYDPRRNLKGVPKDTIKGRHLIRKIGAELIHIKEKLETGEIVEYDITRAEAMIRLMYSSKAPADKATLIKALWPGMLKDEIDVNLKADANITLTWRTFEEPKEE
jgi:hypothetical protein